MTDIKYAAPGTIDEAVALLAAANESVVVAAK